MKTMKSMYDDQLLLDVTILVQDERFPCHRLVLAAVSDYFRAMFTCDLREKTQREIRLHELEAEPVHLLILYAYTGKLPISLCNVQSVLATASLLRIAFVQQSCERYLSTHLCAANVVGIHYFAQAHSCSKLSVTAKEYLEKNFTKVCLEDEFVSLSHLQIGDLISSSELNVSTEVTVFEAVLRWVEHSENERSMHLAYLLHHVRLHLLSSEYFQQNVRTNRLISRCAESVKLITSQAECGNVSTTLRSGMIRPEQCILSICNIHGPAAVYAYNPVSRRTYQMRAFRRFLEAPACVVTEDTNEIFIAGGFICRNRTGSDVDEDEMSDDFLMEDYEDVTVCKDVMSYDNDHDQWLGRAPMLFPKSNFSLVDFRGKLYCFGGVTTNWHPTELIESYDRAVNKWSYVGLMRTPLVDLTTVVCDGYIVLLGGRTGVGAESGVTRFDPLACEWDALPDMPTARFNFGACVHAGEIYVAGGLIYTEADMVVRRRVLDSVEIYDPRAMEWRTGSRLPCALYNVTLSSFDGALHAYGTGEWTASDDGDDGYHSALHRLDPLSGTWRQLETDILNRQHVATVCARLHTRKLTNAAT